MTSLPAEIGAVSTHAEMLRSMAAHSRAASQACDRQAEMARGNAEAPHLPLSEIERRKGAAANFETTANYHRDRAAALEAGAEALEAKQ